MSMKLGPFVGIVLPAIAASACVPIPIPPPEEKPFREAAEEWDIDGELAVENVTARLGEPELEGPGWLLYRKPREGWRWAICVGGGYSFGCGALPGKVSGHFLLVEFDSRRLVSGLEFLTETGLCEDRRICYAGEFLMRPDTAARDVESKKFSVSPEGCSVYTYSETDSDLAAGELVINGKTAGGLVSRSGFYLHSVAPGTHEWTIAPSQSHTLPLPAVTHTFECEGHDVMFLRYRYGLSTFWFNRIEAVDLQRGKKDVGKRWLAISASE